MRVPRAPAIGVARVGPRTLRAGARLGARISPGKGIANPIGAILSVAMLFRFGLKQPQAAEIIEHAVDEVAERGFRTADIARHGERPLSTTEMGTAFTTWCLHAQGAMAEH